MTHAHEPTPVPPAPIPLNRAALWPTMLRAPGLALRPERVAIMTVALALAWLLASIPLPGQDARSLADLWASLAPPADSSPWALPLLTLDRIVLLASNHPAAALFPGLPIAALFILAAAALARMTAVEFALGAFLPLRDGLRFAVSRAPSLLAAFAIPPIFFALLWLLFAAVGAIVLSVPYLNILGAFLFLLAAPLALLACILAATLIVGSPLLVPAAVCESVGAGETGHGDAIDALQRTIAYTLNAPLRLALYGGIGLAQVLLASAVGGFFAAISPLAARAAALHWLSPERAAALARGPAGFFMHLAELLPVLLAAAVTASLAVSASTLAYLLLRRVCDGQDQRELWIPGPTAASAEPHAPADPKPGERDDD